MLLLPQQQLEQQQHLVQLWQQQLQQQHLVQLWQQQLVEPRLLDLSNLVSQVDKRQVLGKSLRRQVSLLLELLTSQVTSKQSMLFCFSCPALILY
jgi:membrane glycosyltransferase